MADAETNIESDPNEMVFKVSTSDNLRNFKNGIRVKRYHYSFSQLISTTGTARTTSNRKLTSSGTGNYFDTYGYISMPQVDTAATGVINGYQNIYRNAQSGSSNIDMDSSSNTLLNVVYPTAGGTIGNAGGIYWNGTTGEPNRQITITLAQGDFVIDLGATRNQSTIHHGVNLALNGTDTETHNDIGTLSYDAFTDNLYYALEYDWQAGTEYYIYMYYFGILTPNNSSLRYSRGTNIVYEGGPEGTTGTNTWIRLFKQVGSSYGVITEDYQTIGELLPLNKVNVYGQEIKYTPTTNTDMLLISIPKYWIVQYNVETSIQTQTTTMMDTTGSDSVIGSATDVSDTIQNKLGFVSQTASTVTNVYDSVMNAEPNGSVTFPGLSWNGQTILAAQQVPLLGWLTPIEDQVRLAITAMLVLAWLHGVRLIYGRIFLGETDVVTDGEE